MTNHPNRTRRIWSTGTTVCLRDADDFTGDDVIREFWVPLDGGYVREITPARPGTLGVQVCHKLSHRGVTLESTREGLLDMIRREYRAAQRAAE